MAVYDLAHRRICVRIVYDGPAGAGKTTNVRQLATAFASQRWGELQTPDELAGRTLWFDWLQIRAGVVCGFPLICQVVTVPGQVALTPRRRQLLASADVVVFVCDSAAAGLPRSRQALELVEDLRGAGATRLPRLLQANKQDHVDALDPTRVAAELGMYDELVVGAIARDGVGVVDTFVAAVRLLSRTLEERMRGEGLRLRAAPVEDARGTLERLARAPIDPEDAAEMVLEEAAALFVGTTASPRATARAVGPVPSVERAPLPTAEVPTGFIWPAHTGRTILRALGATGRLEGHTPLADGAVDMVIDDHVLHTSLADRFDTPDVARQALVHAARERTQLEDLLVAGTVLVVQEARNGRSWLWRVAPRLPRWSERWLASSGERGPLLDALATAYVDGAMLALRRGVALDPRLDRFGLQGELVRYNGELARCEADERAAAILLVAGADEVAALGVSRPRFAAIVARELDRRLGGDGAARAMTQALGTQAA